jgi:pimeloyl-ACP methyl ester carboxylesterase
MKTQTRAIRILDFLKRAFVRVLIFVVVLAIAGVIYQTAATESDQRKYPPPGVLVNVGGYKMHIYCMGEGSPIVILDSANMGTVSNWAWIQPEIARNAEALHKLLETADIAGPYVLVGHSFGGLYVRMFAEIYPGEVVGLVFLEGTLPDGLKRLGKPDVMPNTPDADMMDATPFISKLGILRLVGFPSTDPDLPEPQRSELQAYLASAKLAESLKRQYHLFPTLLAQVRPLYNTGSLGDMPLAVVLGSKGDGGIPEWRVLFAGQAELSTNHILITIDGANHISLVDRQSHALQTNAVILRVVEAVRLGQPLQ